MDRDPIWDEWAKVYEERMRAPDSRSRIHMDTLKLTPDHVRIGDWVLYLPLEITEGSDLPPQMAKVLNKQWTPANICILTTEQGVLQLRKQDTIEVVG